MVVPADVEMNLQPVDGDALLLAARTAHDGKRWNVPVEGWLSLCRQAAEHWQIGM